MRIIDNGVGIDEDGLKNLFADFSRLSQHKSLDPTGTGLGLSICKKIIQKMGGIVNIKSTQGKGTTFKIDLINLCKVNSFQTTYRNSSCSSF